VLYCDVPRCGRAAGYRFAANPEEAALRCLRHAVFYRPVRRRALRVAALVGSVLFLINQADVVLSGAVTPAVLAKIGLTYLVPFSVSTYSALGVSRLRRAGEPAAAPGGGVSAADPDPERG
jgi:hypothetical protein